MAILITLSVVPCPSDEIAVIWDPSYKYEGIDTHTLACVNCGYELAIRLDLALFLRMFELSWGYGVS